MNILLVYPGLVEGFGSFDRGADWFNHGVGIISAVLKKAGHAVRYVDCRKLRGWRSFESTVSTAPFDVALISIATVDFDASRRIASIIRKIRPEARIIVGGPHPTLMTEETASVPEFDLVFTHEAEISLPTLLDGPFPRERTIRGAMPLDLDALPFVDRDLSPEGEHPWFEGLERPYFSITASRGCLYQCTFCQPAEKFLFGDRVRKRSVDNILEELTFLQDRYGLRSFMIHDDCFTQYYQWVEEFCEKKSSRGLVQPFVCQTRADIICKKPDLIKALRDSGLRWVLIGFESGSDRILRFLRKGVTVEQNLEAARICKSLGIKILANYMFGIPTETPEEMRMTMRMIRVIAPEIHSPAVFTPAPGSTLYRYCMEKNLNLITRSEGYRRNPFTGPKIKGVDYDLISTLIHQSSKGPVKGWLFDRFVHRPLSRIDLLGRLVKVKSRLTGEV